jgi:hypothetical protein
MICSENRSAAAFQRSFRAPSFFPLQGFHSAVEHKPLSVLTEHHTPLRTEKVMSQNEKPSKDPIVNTPGGPRAASLIQTVQPGQVVQQASSNTFNILRKPSTLTALHRELLATGEYAITPGGIRHKSTIHEVKPGEVVRPDNGVNKRFNVERQQFIDNNAPPAAPASELPGLGSGWITYASYIEPAATRIREMWTTWTVPPPPTRQDGQLIYLFNGLQDIPVTQILQPVLQWGVSPDGGGNSWAVANWLVPASTTAPTYKSPLVAVNPGDTLVGGMKLLDHHAGGFDFWISFFDNIPGANLSIYSYTQFVMPVEVLECYTLVECRDYPNALLTSMRNIDVRDSNGSLALSFVNTDQVKDCGQHTIVVSNNAGAGQVDLYYTTQFSVPVSSVATSVSRDANHIDVFAVAADGSMNSTFWSNDGGWLNRWFRLADPNFGDAFTVPPLAPISVLSRFAQHLDLFVVGRDQCVYSTAWDGGTGWMNQWFRLADNNFGDGFRVPVLSPVSALARSQDNIDLFVTGFDGSVFSTAWSTGNGWLNHWFKLGDPNFGDQFTIPPAAQISSVARTRDNIDLFVAGRDGCVYSTAWSAQGGWMGHWFRLADPNFFDQFTVPPGSPVTAISRMPDVLDLFVSGRDGAVYTTWWTGQGGWAGHWFRLPDPNFGDQFTIPPGSPVSAICRKPDVIDLFVSGRDGAVYTTWWTGQGGWAGHWYRLGDPNFGDQFTVPAGLRVTAQARQQDIIDLFVVGKDSAVYTTWWTGQGGWAGHWFRI